MTSAARRPPSVAAEPNVALVALMLTAASAGWGVGATMTRLAVAELPPITTACVRFGLGALLLLGVLAWRGEASRLPPRRDWRLIAGIGVLGVTGFGALYTVGLQLTGPAEGSLIQGMSPLVTLLLAALLVGEQVRRWQVIGGIVAFLGLAVLLLGGTAAWGGGDLRLLGDLILIVASVCWAGYSVGVRMAASRLGLAETSAYSVLVGTLVLVPVAVLELAWSPPAAVGPAAWGAIAYLAIVSSCLCYLWWNDGVRKIGAGRTAVFTFVAPVAAMLSAIPILGEWPTLAQLVGGALILGGLFLAHRV